MKKKNKENAAPKQRKPITFYKKRPLYVVSTIVLSLLLVATLVIGLFMPSQLLMGSMSSGMGDMTTMGDIDLSELEDGDFAGFDAAESFGEDATDSTQMTVPGGGSMQMDGQMSADGTVPSVGDGTDAMGEMPTTGDSTGTMGQMPTTGDGTDTMTQMPTMGDGTDTMGDFAAGDADTEAAEQVEITATASVSAPMLVLQTVKSHWVIFAVVFGLLDCGSIAMLIILTRKEKKRRLAEAKAAAEAAALAGQVVRPIRTQKKTKHRQNSIATVIVPLVGMFLLVVVVEGISNSSTTSDTSNTSASILSGEAEVLSLDTTLPGAGTLTEEDSQDMTVPEGVSISAWYVSNGDTVEEGDVLAAVDKVSVLSTVESLQTLLETLDEELAEHEDDAVSEKLTATTSGRVKAIYAEAGTDVLDTMYEYGCLMLISLDGTMAVSIETEVELQAGDAVIVTLSDGTEEDGKVESYLKGTAVITLTDNGPAIGEEVTLTTEDGTDLGSGTLYIHSELKVTGYAGTVEKVKVSVDDKVSAGNTLLTLSDTAYTGDYLTILAQREALEQQINTLFGLYLDGYIYASCSGVVSGIDEDSVTGTSAGLIGGVISLLTGGTDTGEEDYLDFVCVVTAIDSQSGIMTLAVSAQPVEVEDYTDLSDLDFNTDNMTSTVEIEISDAVMVYTCENGVWTTGTMSDLSTGDLLVLTCNRTNEENVPLWMIYAGSVIQQAVEEQSVAQQAVEEQPGTEQSDTASGCTCGCSQTGICSCTSDANSSGDMSDGNQSDTQSATSDTDLSSLLGEGTDTSSSGGSSSGGSSSASQSMTEEVTTSVSYAVSETTILSITPQDSMVVTISVDELDILSLELGQTAQVTLDALPGQSFEGTVTAINTSGSNSGGSSKFTVDVTIPRNSSMLVGMNASVKIILSTTDHVLTIPVVALTEEDSVVYVYTSYDEKTDTLGDPVEVTTGLSDGENVEILSGLEEGDTYWYSYLDTVNYSVATASSSSGISFSFGNMGGGF